MSDGSAIGRVVKVGCAALGLIATVLTLSDRLPTRIETFHSTAYSVSNGDHVTITWRVKGYGTKVFLDGQPVPNDDARDFLIDGPRSFVLTARGTFGEEIKHVEITTNGSSTNSEGNVALSPPADSGNRNLAIPHASREEPDSFPPQSTPAFSLESGVRPSAANTIADSTTQAQSYNAIDRWLERFVSASQGPPVQALRVFYADTVSPYFGMKSANWEDIERDKEVYFGRFPRIRYTIVGAPQHSTVDNGDRVVEFVIDYFVVRKDGKTSSGRFYDRITLRAIDGSLKAISVEERRIP